MNFKDVLQCETSANTNYSYTGRVNSLRGLLDTKLVNRASDSYDILDNTIVSYVFPTTYVSMCNMLKENIITPRTFRKTVTELYCLLDPRGVVDEIDFL